MLPLWEGHEQSRYDRQALVLDVDDLLAPSRADPHLPFWIPETVEALTVRRGARACANARAARSLPRNAPPGGTSRRASHSSAPSRPVLRLLLSSVEGRSRRGPSRTGLDGGLAEGDAGLRSPVRPEPVLSLSKGSGAQPRVSKGRTTPRTILRRSWFDRLTTSGASPPPPSPVRPEPVEGERPLRYPRPHPPTGRTDAMRVITLNATTSSLHTAAQDTRRAPRPSAATPSSRPSPSTTPSCPSP